jgi:hypothetical protein
VNLLGVNPASNTPRLTPVTHGGGSFRPSYTTLRDSNSTPPWRPPVSGPGIVAGVKVYLPAVTAPTDTPGRPPALFRDLAARDRFKVHTLVDAPEDADILLFTEAHLLDDDWSLSTLRHSELWKRHADRSMVYDERDKPWCWAPGVYVSMPRKRFDVVMQRAWGYYQIHPRPRDGARDLLASFVASRSAPCRAPLFDLKHDRVLVSEAKGFVFYDPTSSDFERSRFRFEESLVRSKFVLCPRGRGTSSIRMYEAMSAGCVPVIIADDWVPPHGIDLNRCTIRWPEGRAKGLLDRLELLEPHWDEMSAAAVATFDDNFGPEASYHRIIELCSQLVGAAGAAPRIPSRAWAESGLYTTRKRVRRVITRSVRRPAR